MAPVFNPGSDPGRSFGESTTPRPLSMMFPIPAYVMPTADGEQQQNEA